MSTSEYYKHAATEYNVATEYNKTNATSSRGSGSIVMQQHSGVGIYQVMTPVIRDTVRPIPTVNQIGMPRRKFFRFCTRQYLQDTNSTSTSFCGDKIEPDCSEDEGDYDPEDKPK